MAHRGICIGGSDGARGEIAETEVKASLCSLVKVVHEDPEWLLELTGDIPI